jgi:hypothetical protein
MSVNPVSMLPTSYDHYIRHGWYLVPIPPNTKAPKTPNWNRKENCNYIPHSYGAGIAHAYSGTMALDVDHWDEAAAYLGNNGIDLQALFDAKDAVTINSGMSGHGKLLYAMPFGLALPSKKLIATAPDGSKFNFIDFRCATNDGLTVQDVMPPSIHPITLQPYGWGGAGKWEQLPTIPFELLALWQSLIEVDTVRNISMVGAISASWDEIKEALYKIPASVNRDQWVTIGMALHYAGQQSNSNDDALAIWNDWSAQSEKYQGMRDIDNCWRSFKADEKGVKLGTLFKIAADNGWKRQLPDISTLFKQITQDPHSVIDKFTLKRKPPVLDLSLFPELLAVRAEEVSHEIGCDPVVPLLASLSAICAAVDKQTRLKITDTWKVPPILWLMTIGESSDKKSPGARPYFKILQKLQSEYGDKYKAELLMWKGQEARYASQLKAFTAFHQSAETMLTNNLAPKVDHLAPEPKDLRLVISDVTSQKLVHMADGRPRGFLLFLDEMANWLKVVNDAKSGDDRGAWIAGYESEAKSMDRVGAGTIKADNLAVAIYGNVQPDVFKHHITLSSRDGLLQRFLPIVVDGDKNKIWNEIPSYMTHNEDFENMIRGIFKLPTVEYAVSEDAKLEFRKFSQWYLEMRASEIILKASNVYMTALGKIEGSCLRMALVFHLVNDPGSIELSLDTMKQTIKAMKKFFIPSLKYAFADIAGERDTLSEWVTDYIIQCASVKNIISLTDIKRSSRRQTEGVNLYQLDLDLKNIMMDLQDAHYVICIDDVELKNPTWAINSELAIQFSAHRQKTIDAKQFVVDSFEAEGVKRYGRPLVRKANAIGYKPE